MVAYSPHMRELERETSEDGSVMLRWHRVRFGTKAFEVTHFFTVTVDGVVVERVEKKRRPAAQRVWSRLLTRYVIVAPKKS